VRRLQVCDALRLVPTGPGTTDHLDDDVAAPGAISLNQGLYEVGRAPPADIVIAIPTVSTRHATLRVGADSIVLTDLGSTNGTYLDGQELEPTQAVEVGVGQEVVFGDKYLAKFRLDAEEDAPAAPAAEAPAAEPAPAEPAAET
jgi:pSer/pThr/pTyr-binding forkhead associated (FHA) protein